MATTAVPRAAKVATVTAMAEVAYPLLERARLLVAGHGGLILEEQFAAEITLTARFREEEFPGFAADLRELTHGASEAIVMAADPATLMPL